MRQAPEEVTTDLQRKHSISGNALIDGLLADKFDVARKYEIAVENKHNFKCADTARCEHFALERVLQIAQFAFVESKC